MIHARGEVEFDGDGPAGRRPRHLPGRHRAAQRRGRAAQRRAALPPRLRRRADRHGADRPRGPLAAAEPRDRADVRPHRVRDARRRAWTTFNHPEDGELDRPLVRELLAGRRRSYAIEKRFVHADGRVLHVLAHVSLMHGDGERPLYFLVQLVDLSERRRAEAERRAGEQRMQAVIDNAPALIFVKDTELRYVLVNRRWEELSGVSAERGDRPRAAPRCCRPRASRRPRTSTARCCAPGAATRAHDRRRRRATASRARVHPRQVPAVRRRRPGQRRLHDRDGHHRPRAAPSRQRQELEQRLGPGAAAGERRPARRRRRPRLQQPALGDPHLRRLRARRSSTAEHPIHDDVVEIGRAADRAAALTRQLLMFSRREVVTPEVLDLGALVARARVAARRARSASASS